MTERIDTAALLNLVMWLVSLLIFNFDPWFYSALFLGVEILNLSIYGKLLECNGSFKQSKDSTNKTLKRHSNIYIVKIYHFVLLLAKVYTVYLYWTSRSLGRKLGLSSQVLYFISA